MKLTVQEISDTLKRYSSTASYVDISERLSPNKEVTAEELNEYVQSKDLLGQEKNWVEISFDSAKEYLTFLTEYIEYKPREDETGIPNAESLVSSFFLNFTSATRFFTNGICHDLKAYPNENGSIYVMRPFKYDTPVAAQNGAWNSFKEEFEDDAHGVVAVDEHLIGYFLINTMF